MDQDIAEGNDASKFGDRCRGGWINTSQVTQRFAYDLELALDGRAEVLVRLVIGKGFAGRETGDSIGGLLRIPK